MVVFLLLLQLKEGKPSLLNEIIDEKVVCHISDSSFWKLYNWHFANATTVKIYLLKRKNPNLIKSYISNILYDLFADKKLKRSFIIEKNSIPWLGNTSELTDIHFVRNYNYVAVSKEKDNVGYLQKLRKLSGDPYNAFILVVFDLDDLTIFLKEQHYTIFRNPRGSYIIIILTPHIPNINRELKHILYLLWDTYGVLNVKVKLPCSNLYKKIFGFNPFVYNATTWGTMYQFDMEDAINKPLEHRNTLKNMQGFPVNISLFQRNPTAVLKLPKSIKDNIYYKLLQDKSGGYGGVDGTVLAYISDYLNFTPRINTPLADRDYGLNLNGTLVGSLGDVVYHMVAASFNGRFISQYDSDQIEFTNPISNDFLCLVVPKSEKIPQWLKISRCFKSETWISISGLYFAISIYWSLANKVVISTETRKRNMEDSFFEVLTLFISVSFRKVSLNHQKIFVGICLIFNLVFVGTFQGSLYKSYTKESYFPDINTLEELDSSNLQIITSSKSMAGAFGNDPIPIMRRLKEKIRLLNGTSAISRAAKNRNSAAFERRVDARFRIKTEHTRPSDGFELLHIMDECPWTYYISYIVPIGSPYLPMFNFLINTFQESGLINKWNLDIVDAVILEKRVRPTEQTDTIKPFSLTDIQAAFYLVILGLIFAFVVFIVETFVYWRIGDWKKNEIIK